MEMEELDKNNKNENYYSYSGRQTSSKKSMETDHWAEEVEGWGVCEWDREPPFFMKQMIKRTKDKGE